MKTLILSATVKDELNWEQTIQQAQDCEEKILWQLDFGWNQVPLNIWNTAHFQSHLLTVDECLRTLQKAFPSKKQSISFFHVTNSFSKYLHANELLELRYEEFLGKRAHDPLLFELFCASLISEYLHRLASVLPVDFAPSMTIESLWTNDAFVAQLFCSRRFAHFKKIFSKKKSFVQHPDAPIGIVIPQDLIVEAKIFEQLNNALQVLKRNNQKYSCIPEELLNESWHGVEDLVIIKAALSDLGLRMIHGFVAAGGRIVTLDEKLGFEDEIFLEDNYIKNLGIKSGI